MVTGAYYPEVSGSGLQCRALVQSLQDRVSFTVLTTSTDTSLPREGEVGGVPVFRVVVDVTKLWSKVRAALRVAWIFMRRRNHFDIVHLHGFSQKSYLAVLLTRIFRKRLIIKLTSAGFDDPLSMRRRGWLASRLYAQADLYVGVSVGLEQAYRASELSQEKFWLIPNGVNLQRFQPTDQRKRQDLRRQLGLPADDLLILFIGFFSHEKCPDVLFQAWTQLQLNGAPRTGLLFIGATRGQYYEIDPHLARAMQDQARRLRLEDHVAFVELTHDIEQYYGAADIFVLPSVREGLPNALLEAMASGLPCIATRLPGSTDTVINDGVNGLLIPPRDVGALEHALRLLLQDRALAQVLGQRARQTIEERFAMTQIAQRHLEVYRHVDRRPGA